MCWGCSCDTASCSRPAQQSPRRILQSSIAANGFEYVVELSNGAIAETSGEVGRTVEVAQPLGNRPVPLRAAAP